MHTTPTQTTMQAIANDQYAVRALRSGDLGEVVAIDAAIEGRSRRAYVERRLAAALRDPGQHAQFAAVDGNRMAGYLAARLLEGEFGRDGRSLRIELVGVRPDARGRHVGRALFDALASWAARHAIRELRTQAAWNDTTMLRWLDAMGFQLAPNTIVDFDVGGAHYRPERDDALDLPVGAGPGHEIDFSDNPGNDFERRARDSADVHSMTRADLADIVRIDRGITGRDRGGYMSARLAEAVDDASLRVSLAARRDGANVGYLMASVDRGDFGRTEPVAVIDTIGVDPEYAHRGVGRALLAQLFLNLDALRIERVETVVDRKAFALLGFFYDVGFAPGQRLAFVKTL